MVEHLGGAAEDERIALRRRQAQCLVEEVDVRQAGAVLVVADQVVAGDEIAGDDTDRIHVTVGELEGIEIAGDHQGKVWIGGLPGSHLVGDGHRLQEALLAYPWTLEPSMSLSDRLWTAMTVMGKEASPSSYWPSRTRGGRSCRMSSSSVMGFTKVASGSTWVTPST